MSPAETVARARARSKLQAETAIMALGPGRLLPFQAAHLVRMAEEFGEAEFNEALQRVLAANDQARAAGRWPGFSQPDQGIGRRGLPVGAPTHASEPSMGSAPPTPGPLPPGAPVLWERMTARDRHDYLRDHGPDAYRALRADWERRGSPR